MTQDCEDGQTCVPVNDVFVCIPGGAGKGTYGTPCDNIAACDPGLVCVAAEAVPDCMSNGCCTELCSLSDPAGNDQCTGAPEGQQCQPWYDEPPPGFEDVGFCTLPT